MESLNAPNSDGVCTNCLQTEIVLPYCYYEVKKYVNGVVRETNTRKQKFSGSKIYSSFFLSISVPGQNKILIIDLF